MANGITAHFQRAKILTRPEIKDGQNGKFISFMVKGDDQMSYKILCFDDEREKNPYKKFVSAMEKGYVVKGTYVILDTELCRYPTYAITDDFWAKCGGRGKNPTLVYIDTFKLLKWDYLIPVEVHEKLKAAEKPHSVAPITAEQMGGSIL